MWPAIAQQIATVTGVPFEIKTQRSVGGGCINQGYAIGDGTRRYFVKTNGAAQVEMFAAEFEGLQAMRRTASIRIPEPMTYGTAGAMSYIVLEWLDLGSGDRDSGYRLGQALAAMHRYAGANQFGWTRNNTIGSTPQMNPWTDSWAEFFAEHRIGYQLRLARRKGGSFPDVRDRVYAMLQDHHPQPSLVHGDLWSGNAACTTEGEPVIFDPATYWGDREVDIAMTELFGGYPTAFYQGYAAAWPLSAGYTQRKTLYNLYHILNHFNLFGGGYGAQAQRLIAQLG